MKFIDALAYWFGAGLFLLFAMAVLAFLAFHLTDYLCRKVFTRMRRLYHLSSVAYWLDHYERRGRKCFLDPDVKDSD